MTILPTAIQKTLQERKNIEKRHIEIKKIHNNYYLYHATSKYNPKTKKPTKTTTYIGTITPDGTYKPKQPKKREQSTATYYQYANSQLCQTLSKDIQEALTNTTKYKNELIALSITKTINPSPLYLTQSIWDKLYASKTQKTNLTSRHLTDVLREIGNNPQIYNIYTKLAQEGGILFYDLTAILTYSKNLKLAEKGYNAKHSYENQVNIIMAFSTVNQLPIATDVFYGSIRDIKTIRHFTDRFKCDNMGFIFDRGFSSYKLLSEFKENKIHYIVPLKRNSKFLRVDFKTEGALVYRKRSVGFCKVKNEYGFLYLFLDPSIRADEEHVLLSKVKEGVLSLEEYELLKKCAGVFGVVSDLDCSAEEIYGLYKDREEVELVFDVMKNELEADKTYLRCEEAVRGYFVVVLFALRLHFKILNRLREKKLVGEVSVREVLFELSKIELSVEDNGREIFCAFPKRSQKILSIFSDLIPMGYT